MKKPLQPLSEQDRQAVRRLLAAVDKAVKAASELQQAHIALGLNPTTESPRLARGTGKGGNDA